MDLVVSEKQQLIAALEKFVLWAESEFDNKKIHLPCIVEIDGTYLVETDFPEYKEYSPIKRGGLREALQLERNLAHRIKYFIETNYNIICNVENFYTVLTAELKRKKEFLVIVRSSL